MSTNGGAYLISDDIASIWKDIIIPSGQNAVHGTFSFSNGNMLFHGTYYKYNDTLGSVHMTAVDGTSYIWNIDANGHYLNTVSTISDIDNELAIEEVTITPIDSTVVIGISQTSARKIKSTKMFSFGIYFTLNEKVIKEGTKYVNGFARPLGSAGGINPVFNCIYRNTANGATRVGTCYIGYEGNLICGYRDHVDEISGYDQVFVNGVYPYV